MTVNYPVYREYRDRGFPPEWAYILASDPDAEARFKSAHPMCEPIYYTGWPGGPDRLADWVHKFFADYYATLGATQ